MTVGVLFFAIGMFDYTQLVRSIAPIKSTLNISKIIAMAAVDGVLTQNERNLIKK